MIKRFFLLLFTAITVAAQSPDAFNVGLGNLPLLNGAKTRSISAENPTGEKGKGGMVVPGPEQPFSNAASDLGQRWKVSPFVKPKAHQTLALMVVDGPGVIQHIWMATETSWVGNGRASVLRSYWDNETTPSVEVPMTDFFAVGHEEFARVNSLAVIVNPKAALNCFWPMPFRKHARQLSYGWFGEGEMKFFIDGDGKFPTINGTGTEDYFGASYGFPENYTTAYIGNTLDHAGKDGPPKWSLYRWHIMDPINFQADLKITIQTLGWWPNHKYQPLSDDLASVAYWYQTEPHAPFPPFHALFERWPR